MGNSSMIGLAWTESSTTTVGHMAMGHLSNDHGIDSPQDFDMPEIKVIGITLAILVCLLAAVIGFRRKFPAKAYLSKNDTETAQGPIEIAV